MTYTEILKETQFLLGLENDTNFAIYTKEQMTRHSNRALDDLTSEILKVDGSWQWDDKNYPDLPIAETDLVANQGQYTISAKHLLVHRLEIESETGGSIELKPISQSDIHMSIEEYSQQTGTPTHYEKLGESLILYPKPDYDLENGMRIYFSRPAQYYEVTDTDKEAGFAEIFHLYIPIWNALHYSSSNVDMAQIASNMKVRLDEMKERITKFYSQRRMYSRLTPRVPNSL